MAEEKKPEEPEVAEEVTIRRTKIMVPAVEGEAEAMVYITYSTKDLPPSLITIPEKEWTAEKEAELIREDIKKRRETKPSTIRL